MIELIETVEVEDACSREPVCLDKDEDCEDMENHLHCWMYDMGRGRCPYLTGEDQ